ncbi:MAG TPA: hypothetical protein VHX16_01745 [Chloroflexota bacterium]|nr:hypothetical protein [Chloroflexota bacterium]
MPKPRRRTYRKFRPNQPTDDGGRAQQEIDREARALITALSADGLKSELANREARMYEADQAAQMDPNPASLAQFRRAQMEYRAAQAACKMQGEIAQ